MGHVQAVRSYKHANVLIEKGYKLLKIDRNKRDRSQLIFIFEYTDTIRDDLRKLDM